MKPCVYLLICNINTYSFSKKTYWFVKLNLSDNRTCSKGAIYIPYYMDEKDIKF